jgi:hypothetical protein
MKKIIIIISVLILGIVAVTWLYFKNLSATEHSNENVFKVIPNDAAIVFEYKNEDSFYDIFNDFSLFGDLLGRNNLEHLNALKQVFVDDANISPSFKKSNLFFSLHQNQRNNAEILIVAPFSKEAGSDPEEIIASLKTKFRLISDADANQPLYQLSFNNKSTFYFIIYQSLMIGSFEKTLVNHSKELILSGKENNSFKIDFKSPRNKNSIANLYLNISKIPDLLNNFSDRKNPSETFALKYVDAFASLNINYQSSAFMFSGVTKVNEKANNYFNLFLNQESGNNTLKNILPFDAATYSFFYVSDYKKFKQGLNKLFVFRKESEKLKKQLDNITQRHSINIDKELMPVMGNEFGVMQLASGDKIGVVKTTNTIRLSFLLSTISSEAVENIRLFDDSYLLYSYLGDPFKSFQRPYYIIIENHLIVANNTIALRNFQKNYTNQNLLSRSDKNIDFQQYLSNQGNIFYFIHNSNAKAIVKSFLSGKAHENFKSDDFDWKNIYGLSIQFSADKDKFFTNLYLSKIPEPQNLLPSVDSVLVDSLVQ